MRTHAADGPAPAADHGAHADRGGQVIRAIGLEMIKMTASRGFMIELAAASTVVTASILGLPISTTHCGVGATVAVGLMEGQSGFNKGLFFKTATSWVVTLFFAAIVSMTIFSFAYFSP
jgi:phosphate/sulfate permease